MAANPLAGSLMVTYIFVLTIFAAYYQVRQFVCCQDIVGAILRCVAPHQQTVRRASRCNMSLARAVEWL